MECDNKYCGEIVVVAGVAEVDDVEVPADEGTDWVTTEALTPHVIVRAPPVFPLVPQCPKDIRDEIQRAFSLYWIDPGSCANAIRSAVEILLDLKKIKRFSNANGRRVRIPLHHRIVLFEKEDPDIADALLAIKWLGNEGSHAGPSGLKKHDLLDGFDIFEHVIDSVFVNRDKQIAKLAREINKRKGPRSARPKRASMLP